jgi:hypothetical protein
MLAPTGKEGGPEARLQRLQSPFVIDLVDRVWAKFYAAKGKA